VPIEENIQKNTCTMLLIMPELRMLLFRARKKALEKNSTNNTISVDIAVSTKSLMYLTDSLSENGRNSDSILFQKGASISTTSNPYTTKTRLMPTSVVPIKRAGLSA
jgi:hypothetical protein